MAAIRSGSGRVKAFSWRRKSDSRLHHVDNNQPDHQRDRRDDFEVEQRFGADAAEPFEIAHRRNAMDNGAKDDRRDHHFHELDEGVAERFKRLAKLRREISNDNSQDHPPTAPARKAAGTREVGARRIECECWHWSRASKLITRASFH